MRTAVFALLAPFLAVLMEAGADETPVSPEEWKAAVFDICTQTERAEALPASLPLPLLHSPRLQRRWGQPEARVAPDGHYVLHYHNPDPDSPFERVWIYASPDPLPRLDEAPPQLAVAEVDGELGEIEKPQDWQHARVKWRSPDGRLRFTVPFFRAFSGGGADGPMDMTNAFSLSVGGMTGYYVVAVESITGKTAARIEDLRVD